MGNRTHLPSSWRADKYQKRDQIAHWIFPASAYASASFKTNFGISKCNLIPSPKDPSQPRLTEVMKLTTVLLGLHYWEIQ
jgi:hypothetical protein